jgi:hypothetical protein
MFFWFWVAACARGATAGIILAKMQSTNAKLNNRKHFFFIRDSPFPIVYNIILIFTSKFNWDIMMNLPSYFKFRSTNFCLLSQIATSLPIQGSGISEKPCPLKEFY